MKIGFLMGHPTQFEGPFFQYAARDAGHECQVIYSDAARLQKVLDHELQANVGWGVDLLSGYSYRSMPARGRLRWLHAEIKRERYDLLIINGYNRFEYVFAALVAKFYRTPVALRLDSILLKNRSITKRCLKKVLFVFLSRLYRHFFAVGTLTRQYLQHFGVAEDRVSVFSYVVDNEYFERESRLAPEARESLRKRYDIQADDKVVVAVTKFNRREAPWDLLKAFCKLPPDGLCLLLVGDGEELGALRRFAGEFPTHRIVFAGYVRYPDLPKHYGISDAFVHPALDEPWGVSVQEALACGLPVVASSNVGAGYDLILEGQNGFVYRVSDPLDLVRCLEQTLGHLSAGSVAAANAHVLSRWNYPTAWENILNVARRYKSG